MGTNTKIVVRICTGTLCHVMGGAELPELPFYLPDYMKSKVEIKGMVCGEYCKDSSKKPPFVTINDVLIEQASIEKIINYIEKHLADDPQ